MFCLFLFTLVYIKDIINPYNCLLKKTNFSIKTSNDLTTHLWLNSQFIVVLDGIICFSVRFCNNSLLMLQMRFQVFPFASKKLRFFKKLSKKGFSSDRKILMSLLSVLFHPLKPPIFFKEMLIMSQKSTSFPKELWKPFISRAKQIKRNLRHALVDEWQLKTIMFLQIYLVPFCSSKLVHFFKFSFKFTFPTSFQNVSFSQ